VLQWLKAQPLLCRIPVIILTSSADAADVNAAYDSGANSFLVKPLAFDALVKLLTALNQFWILANERPAIGLDC